MLVAEGVNSKTVQERLGHERISTTLELMRRSKARQGREGRREDRGAVRGE
ncbi:MAG: hypothetical protein ACI362_02820 [Coriobacteriales bacterium]